MEPNTGGRAKKIEIKKLNPIHIFEATETYPKPNYLGLS